MIAEVFRLATQLPCNPNYLVQECDQKANYHRRLEHTHHLSFFILFYLFFYNEHFVAKQKCRVSIAES